MLHYLFPVSTAISMQRFVAGLILTGSIWLLLHLIFIIVWALAFDGSSKCYSDIDLLRLNLIKNITEIFALKLISDLTLLWLFFFLLFKRTQNYNKTKIRRIILIPLIFYFIGFIDWLGLSIHDAMKYGKDCDPAMPLITIFSYFGYLVIPGTFIFYSSIIRTLRKSNSSD